MKKKPAKGSEDLVAIAGGVRAPRAEVAHVEEDLWPLTVAIDTLTPDPKNLRVHPEANKAAIRASLLEYGQQKPVSVDAGGVILAGNGTWEQAVGLGWKYLARVRTSLDELKKRGWKIVDNRSSDLSEFDAMELQAELQALSDLDFSGLDLGFTDEQLSALVEGDVETAHSFATNTAEPKPPRESKKKNGGKLVLIAHFTSEKQQREWGDKLIAAGVEVDFRLA